MALHHPPYSLDIDHSNSKLLAEASAKAKRRPHMVFAAHVHNDQRFTVADAHGHGVTPFLVAGQGGYHNLHKMAQVDGQPLPTPYAVPDMPGVTLNSYYDDRFGFLRLTLSCDEITVQSYTVPRPQEPWTRGVRLFDTLRFDWRKRVVLP